MRPNKSTALIALLLAGVASVADAAPSTGEEDQAYEQVAVRGRVTWAAEALRRLHGVRSAPDADERMLVLETAAGALHPILEDARGVAFRRDERLRKFDVEIVARRHRDSPFLQTMQIREIRGEDRFALDYWCEICAISMVELKECDCCQGPTELRRRLVEERESREAPAVDPASDGD